MDVNQAQMFAQVFGAIQQKMNIAMTLAGIGVFLIVSMAILMVVLYHHHKAEHTRLLKLILQEQRGESGEEEVEVESEER